MATKQTGWSRAYNEKAYDRLAVTIPKGRKTAVEALAKERGESVNGLINSLLRGIMGLSEDEWKNPQIEPHAPTLSVKPLMLEELTERMIIYLEFYGRENYSEPYQIYEIDTESDCVSFFSFGSDDWFSNDTKMYNKTWRCWAHNPTDDERSAAAWETLDCSTCANCATEKNHCRFYDGNLEVAIKECALVHFDAYRTNHGVVGLSEDE